MRRDMFGGYHATTTDDDIGEAFMANEVEADECFADIVEDGEGGYSVEIRDNESGDEVVCTDAGLFNSPDDARKWARSWVSNVNDSF